MSEPYVPIIIALLPLSAFLLVIQVNPYQALVMRGVLGAVAALVDVLLGAADVALTEALVGTMLAITLYAVAVRSSMVLRLGVVGDSPESEQLMTELRSILSKRHLRLELVSYGGPEALEQGLQEREVHAICGLLEMTGNHKPTYQAKTRIQRIYDILHSELTLPDVTLTYVNVPNLGEKH